MPWPFGYQRWATKSRSSKGIQPCVPQGCKSTSENFTQRETHLDVQFSDGSHDWLDLLVGADGQGSRTPKLNLGSTPDPFHPLGVHIGYFTVPQEIQPGEEYNAAIYIAPGGHFIFTRRYSPHAAQVYLACKTDSDRLVKAHGNTEEEKDGLAEIFRGAGWQTERILKELQSANDFYCERLGVVRMDSWSAGRVALVGDAAYCPSATTGMGTTSGLVGAYILAGEISNFHQADLELKDRLLALKAYDDTYRPFISQVQKGIEKARHSGTTPHLHRGGLPFCTFSYG